MMAAGLLTPVTAPIMSPGPQHVRTFNFKPMTPINELSSRIWDSQTGVTASETDGNCCKPKKKKKPKPTIPTLDLDPAQLCKRENIYATPFYRQLSILLLRTFLLIWRDSSLTTMRFCIHLAIGLLIGFLYYNIGNDANNSLNNFRYVFYTIMFIMYCAFSGILVKCKSDLYWSSKCLFNNVSLFSFSSSGVSDCVAGALQSLVFLACLLCGYNSGRFAHTDHLQFVVYCAHISADRTTTWSLAFRHVLSDRVHDGTGGAEHRTGCWSCTQSATGSNIGTILHLSISAIQWLLSAGEGCAELVALDVRYIVSQIQSWRWHVSHIRLWSRTPRVQWDVLSSVATQVYT